MTPEISATQDLAMCHRLRRIVFIEEQGIPEPDEWDDLDGQAIHLLATLDGVAVGTARLLKSNDTGKIGRICVLKSARGTGLGAALVSAGIDQLAKDPALSRVQLSAQVHATGFYQKLGFSICSGEYDDAGIPHQDMERAL